MAGNNTNYTLPLGIDPNDFFSGLNEIRKGLNGIQQESAETSKVVQDAFKGAARETENFGKGIKNDTAQLAALKEAAKAMGKEVAEALNGKSVGTGLEEKVKRFQQLLEETQKTGGVDIGVNINDAKLEEFIRTIGQSSDELKNLQVVIQAAQARLAELDPNSEEFQQLSQQVALAEGLLEGFAEAEQVADTSSKSLKGQLREIKAELAALELAGQGGSERFVELSMRAGELEDQIGDVSQRVRVLASDTKYLDAAVEAVTALAGAFAAAQGVQALLGSENEELNKSLQKVTGALAVLQGIQAVATALNKDSTLSVLLLSRAQTQRAAAAAAAAAATTTEAGATVAATAATRGFTAALLANPLTLILVAIAAAITALIAFASSSDDAERASLRLNSALDAQNELLELNVASLKRRTDLAVAQAKALGAVESDITGIQGRSLQKQLDLQNETNEELRKLYNAALNTEKLKSEDFQKISDDYNEGLEKAKDLENQIEIKALEQQKQRADEVEKASKKRADDAKKAAEEQRKIREQVLQFTKVLQDEELASMKEGFDKERKEAQVRAQQRIDELNKNPALSEQAEKLRNQAILKIRQNLTSQLLQIDKDEASKRAQVQSAAQQTLIDLMEEGVKKEVAAITFERDEKIREITEAYKTESAVRNDLIDAVFDDAARKEKAARLKYKQEGIEQEQAKELAVIDVLEKFSGRAPAIEEAKQQEILRVKIKYAKASLDALIASGADENGVQVAQARAVVANLQRELEKAVSEAGVKKISLTSLLGLDKLAPEDLEAIKQGVQAALDGIRQITESIVQQYQTQIDERKKVIDEYDKSIDELEEQLEKEQDLRDEGLANNVKAVEEEIKQKQKARDDEQAKAKELLDKQRKVQEAQMALDTVVQASSLITAAAQIIKGFSAIPIVGVALGIAAVGVMIGGFIAAKVAAFNALKQGGQQTFGGGGWIDGPSHASGGRKYVANDGSGDVVEVEGGEHVTNKYSSAKYADLLDAINDDRLEQMSDADLRDLLSGIGVHAVTDLPEEALKAGRDNDAAKAQYFAFTNSNPSGGDIRRIREDVAFMASEKRKEVDRWEDDEFRYTRKGNVTTKIKK